MGLYSNLSLFSGAGGLDLAARWTGRIRSIGYCELDPYAQHVLRSRIASGDLDDAPIWDDVRTFDPRPWKGYVDVVSGGFPCKDTSTAGNRAGVDKGEHSGLWKEMRRIIRTVRPRVAFVENPTGVLVRGMGTVCGELSALGYNIEWCSVGAADVGAPHIRKRVWILAYTDESGSQRTRRELVRPAQGTRQSRQTISDAGRGRGPNKKIQAGGNVPRVRGAELAHTDGGRFAVEWQPEPAGEQSERGRQSDRRRPVRELDDAAQGMAHTERARREGKTRTGIRGDGQPSQTARPTDGDSGRRRRTTDRSCEGTEATRGKQKDRGTRRRPVAHTDDVAGSQTDPKHDPIGTGWDSRSYARWRGWRAPTRRGWWSAEPGMGRVVNGMGYRVDRLRCTGNGVVPHCAFPFWKRIVEILEGPRDVGRG